VAIPDRIGRYRVLELLGRGAMGIVYLGLDEALDREVAIKVMAGQVEAEAQARFKREAQAAARLQHPNIITVYELGEHQGAPFMALELLHGVDLQRAIEAGLRPDPRRTLPIVLQLLAGLGHAHERGIVHRDVKPSNLFLPRGGPAKIMDFGVARLAAGTTAAGGGLTSTGMVIGTPNYMSPEQVRAGELDGRSDLFSAALILYELVTGEKAYRGDSIVSLLFKIANEDPDLSLLPRGDRWLALRRVLERALQREPAGRYRDASTMAADLLAAWRELGGSGDWSAGVDLGIGPRPRPRVVELGTAGPAPAPPVSLGTQPPEAPLATGVAAGAPASTWTQGPMRAALALGIGAVVVLAFTALLLLRPRAPATDTAPARMAAPGPAVPSPTAGPSAAPPLPTPAPAATPRPSPTATPARRAATPTPAASDEPTPQVARVDRAEQLLEAGRYGSALAEAKAVLQRDPTNAQAQQVAEEAEAALLIEACLKNARAALARGDKDAALEELRKGLAVNSNEARLLALWREATQ
jgi:serine/threonine-protein kinase